MYLVFGHQCLDLPGEEHPVPVTIQLPHLPQHQLEAAFGDVRDDGVDSLEEVSLVENGPAVLICARPLRGAGLVPAGRTVNGGKPGRKKRVRADDAESKRPFRSRRFSTVSQRF